GRRPPPARRRRPRVGIGRAGERPAAGAGAGAPPASRVLDRGRRGGGDRGRGDGGGGDPERAYRDPVLKEAPMRATSVVVTGLGLLLASCVQTRQVELTFGDEGEGLDGFMCRDPAGAPILDRLQDGAGQ